MIAITFALPTESSDLIRRMTSRKIVACAGGKIVLGKVGNREAAIYHTGVGRKSCEGRIRDFLIASQPELLISSGFAGGVGEQLGIGDLIVAENFSDTGLTGEAQRVLHGYSVRIGKLYSSPFVADSAGERNQIAQEHGATAVDMETETIAEICGREGVRLLSLRAISDNRDNPLPLPASILFDLEKQRTNAGRLLSCLVKHPAAIWRLAKFARQIKRVRQTLTQAIVDLLRSDLL